MGDVAADAFSVEGEVGELIDWYTVGVSTLWIVGLAQLLATLSFAHGLTVGQAKSMRQILSELPFRLSITAGIVLFALGMLLSAEAIWEKIGWGVVIALAVWDGVVGWRAARADAAEDER